jgi:hypothetical protein
LRARAATLVGLAAAFLLWNAVFDHVLVVFGDLYIILAPLVAPHGLRARIDDWMGPAKHVAVWAASTVTFAAVVAAAAAAGLARVRRWRR